LLKTTELVSLSGVIPGPDLPVLTLDHCLVKLNETTILMTGGGSKGWQSQYNRNSVYFYNIDAGVWTQGPNMLHARRAHGCSLFYNPANCYKPTVVVSTGWNGQYLDSTEFLVLEPGSNTIKWTEGPSLPTAAHGAVLLTKPDGIGLIHIGGVLKNAGSTGWRQLQCTTQSCQWSEIPEIFEFQRSRSVAMFIPNNMASCTDD
jgi:hypothetical protein